MEVKTVLEEKRVKSTVIRRRAKPEEKAPDVPLSPPSSDILKDQELVATTPSLKISEPLPDKKQPSQGHPGQEKIQAPDADAAETAETVKEKTPHKKVIARKKTKDELEMEMIDRAGGLKRAAELIVMAPERLERVFRPERSSKKRKVISHKDFKKTELTTPKAAKRLLKIEGSITASDLARRMSVKASDVLKKLISLGVMANINQTLDSDTALLVAHDFGFEVENTAFAEQTFLKVAATTQAGDAVPRPPIVTIMGHVDHGKTTLLDRLRKTQVAASEAGGITQHIGAYEVLTPKGSITFIDTPGHEAFTAMRARGAQVTDIVILVVAADDGLMPQTVEAIHHAVAAKVPIIVAVNKIDKPDADPERVERGLMEHGLVSEKLGGDTIISLVSAKTGQGLEELLEMILLQAEVLQLKASLSTKARGTVIEARLDKGRGPVATVIVLDGTLRQGDIIVVGTAYGRVRSLVDANGRPVKEAPPSKPVEVLGLSSVPFAGDKMHVTETEDQAREVSEHRSDKLRETRNQARTVFSGAEDLYAHVTQTEVPEVRVLIKGDVQGSVEALRESLLKLSTEKVRVNVLHTSIGAINESDVMLAAASKASIIGFNMRPDSKARELAARENIPIKTYDIIYNVIEDVKLAMVGELAPTFVEKYLGRADVRQLFAVSKVGTIAGSFVTNGKIPKSASVRCIRDGKVVYEGKLSSLKRFKEDSREVGEGLECGIGIENFNDIKVGDVIEAFQVDSIAGQL